MEVYCAFGAEKFAEKFHPSSAQIWIYSSLNIGNIIFLLCVGNSWDINLKSGAWHKIKGWLDWKWRDKFSLKHHTVLFMHRQAKISMSKLKRSKGPHAGAQTWGRCSEDKASLHGTPALPAELIGAPTVTVLISFIAVHNDCAWIWSVLHC